MKCRACACGGCENCACVCVCWGVMCCVLHGVSVHSICEGLGDAAQPEVSPGHQAGRAVQPDI